MCFLEPALEDVCDLGVQILLGSQHVADSAEESVELKRFLRGNGDGLECFLYAWLDVGGIRLHYKFNYRNSSRISHNSSVLSLVSDFKLMLDGLAS